ncbi:hypothetical protein Pcinc_033935 [Petrolisthes cinctipes]|uniref:Lipocalin/cytosolic fatty-acid binding domain-containing protein n=1 Tax=Petrolisthes cinctipes TaxID=88211 RepID=A0AAE1ER60_PETCI|nr:hypothetical protein Pcinc_033935 [Petrolisthes cinctipes]
MMLLSAVVVVVMMGMGVVGHDWGMGTCPSPQSFPALDVETFVGTWFVISQVDTTSTCLTMTYQKVSETQLTVEKSRQIVLLDTLKIKHLNSYTATLDIPNGEDAAKMRVKWPLNVAGKADYTVITTDYTGHAVVFECQQLSPFIHRKSAAILSRNPTLDDTEKQRLLGLVEGTGISLADMDTIDHSACISKSEAAVNISIDEETLKKLFSDASTNLRQVVTQVANGAGQFATTITDFTRQLSAVEAKPEDGSSVNNYSDIEILE